MIPERRHESNFVVSSRVDCRFPGDGPACGRAAVPKDMLVIGKAADPQTLDPAVTIDNNDWTVTYPSYQRLVKYKTEGDKGSTEVEGDLASGWKASDDQKEWTFTLNDQAKFADGSPVTAEAVKQSFERMLKISGVRQKPFLKISR